MRFTVCSFVRQTQGYLLTFVFASGLLSPWCEWAGGVGLFLFLTAFHGVQDMFLKSINGETKSQLDENSLLFARQMIWVSSIASKHYTWYKLHDSITNVYDSPRYLALIGCGSSRLR